MAAVEEGGYLLRVRDVEAGLPDSSVTCLAQTPDGYLWVGTSVGGLSRFDGQRFVNFNPRTTPGLNSSQIQKLVVDPQGTLWIGTVEGSLISYRDGTFHLERKNLETPRDFLGNWLMSDRNSVCFSAEQGALFFGANENGLHHWQTVRPPDDHLSSHSYAVSQGVIWYLTNDGRLGQVQGGQFVAMPDPPGLSGAKINALVADPAGRLWVGSSRGLAVWRDNDFTDMTPTNSEPALVVEKIAAGPDGALWVWTNLGLRKCRERQWVARVDAWDGNPPSPKDLFFSPLGHLPLNLLGDSLGGLWVSHYGEGLWHVDGHGKVLQMRKTHGLPNALVECWLEDREGNLWLGLNGGGGLVCLRSRIFQHLWPTGNSAQDAAWSVCEDPAGAMWIGTGDTLLRWRDGVFTPFTLPVMDRKAWRDLRVCPDAGDGLWVGSVGNGVRMFNEGRLDEPFPAEAIGTVARAFYRDRVDRLWIGSEFGLFRWEQGRLKRFIKADGFTPADVMSITEDQSGDLWLGTGLGELRRYRDGKFTSFWPEDSHTDPEIIATGAAVEEGATPLQNRNRGSQIGKERFSALLADDGVIWIGSLGGGLLRFQDGKFTRYTQHEGLPGENVSQILKDDQGQLWLGMRNGIARASLADLNRFARGESRLVPFLIYGRDDGLPTPQCSDSSQPACWKSRDGQLWFTTLKGVVRIDPKHLSINSVPPPVVIENIAVDGEWQIKSAGTLPPRLSIPAGRHYIDLKFTALSFTAPDKVRFQWRLAGLEKDWVPASNRRTVNYGFVPRGEYEFQVRACNNDGVWNETGTSLKLTVLPYFWQKLWFKIGAGGLVLLGLLGMGLAIQRRRYQVQMQELERQNALERERTRIARDIHDQVGSNLTKIGMQTGMLGRDPDLPEGVHTLVQDVAETTREMLQSMDEIVWAINPRNDTLENAVNYLIHYTRDFVRPTEITYKLNVPVDLPAQSISAEVRHNLFMAFKEALNNAVKHGHPRSIRLGLELQPRQFKLLLEDDGCGFTMAVNRSGADGLHNMKQRLKSVGGDCVIESLPGQGTKVIFQLPLELTK